MSLFLFFFFQAEDGIRDGHVTGVQTCALPISHAARGPPGSAPGRVPPERGRGPYCSCVWSVRLLRCHSLSRNGCDRVRAFLLSASMTTWRNRTNTHPNQLPLCGVPRCVTRSREAVRSARC